MSVVQIHPCSPNRLWAVDGGRDRSLLKAGSLPVRSTNSILFAELLERITCLCQQAQRDRAVTRVNREEPGRCDLDLHQVSEDIIWSVG